MQPELQFQALKLFDTSEKWNSFLELVSAKDDLVYLSFKQLKQPIVKYFNDNQIKGWICEPWGDKNVDLRWYLEEFGINSLGLTLAWRFEFHLYLNDTTKFDTKKMNDLLKTSEFSALTSAFNRIPDKMYEDQTKAMEYRNYSFGSPFDEYFDNYHVDHLSWYAMNKTEDFANQIIQKVEKFRSPELTEMLYKLNKECQIR